jgi:hypothetical protein
MSTDPHDEIAELFGRFKEAVQQGDTSSYESICVDDAPPETELFKKNSEKVRGGGWKLRIKRIDQEGEVAEVTFDVVGSDGEVIDEAQVTFTEEAVGWRIRSL